MTYSAQELDGYAQIQARLVTLMLRHDERSFGHYYDTRKEFAAEHDIALEPYRKLGVLFALRDELFEHILPRIVRRLSFEAPRETIIEEPPPRGRVDWERTLSSTWAERPGEPPLLLNTRQRRRDFATPENLLVVATLLEYRADIHEMLWSERGAVGNEALRHPLNAIAERCERELAFPQFAGLRRAAQHIIDGDGTAGLEAQVQERLLPGSNSAYEDLLLWRARRRALHLLRRTPAGATDDALGADPDEDNYLYQLWIFYELADLLREARCLDYLDTRPASAELRFHWGDGPDRRDYRLLHDQKIEHYWSNAPGLRPDYYIQRIDRGEVRAPGAKRPIWHDVGYVLDAKYYRPRNGARAPGNPVKRMLADLHLAGERHGALLFAFQRSSAGKRVSAAEQALEPDTDAIAQNMVPLYRVTPEHTAFDIRPDVEIAIWRVLPKSADDANAARNTLRAVLENVHQTLKNPATINCYGSFPDADTVNPGNTQPARCTTCGELLAFCPKPHVSSARIDRVCPRCDCLQNRRVCHIIDQANTYIPPFVRRVLSQKDLLKSISAIKEWLREQTDEADETERADQARKQVLSTLGELTESYIKLTRADITQIERNFREWVFGEYWQDIAHPRGLPAMVRHMLVSGEYVWNEFQHATIEDWAACAVQYIRALEYEMHRRLYDPCGTLLLKSDGTPMEAHQFTFGSPAPMYYNRRKSPNWQTLLTHVAQPSNVDEITLKTLIMDIEAIRLDRNKIAHTERVDAALATKIRDAVLGQRHQPGLLLRLSSLLNAPNPN